MTTTCALCKQVTSLAIVSTAMLSLCLIGCHAQPQDQSYQLTDQEKRQIEQGVKKTNEADEDVDHRLWEGDAARRT